MTATAKGGPCTMTQACQNPFGQKLQDSNVHSPMKALDGWTLHDMLYDMKPSLADLHAFSVLCAIVRLSEKLKKPINAVR